jgi:hypothetical protein
VRGSRRVAVVTVVALTFGLAACAPALPETVVPGTEVAVAWSGELTSLNAAAAPTAANLDVAELIRADFGDLVDGEFVPDEGFGTVKIVSNKPFTVRYDLAEPVWSDGIPLDAADLLLGWAWRAGLLAVDESGAAPDESVLDAEPPKIDEFARSVEVTFTRPDIGWQRAVSAPVPAHVIAQRALDIDDPMEAKQAVITAIRSGDDQTLAKLGAEWRDGAAIEPGETPAADRLVSSGPYLLQKIDESGTSISFAPNPTYRGVVGAKIERVALVPRGDDVLERIGDTVDVAQVSPNSGNRDPIRMLQRKDFTAESTHDGTMWSLQLQPYGVFSRPQARIAFLRAVPASTLAQRGGGEWASDFAGTTSMITAPGSRAYDIVAEDSGFTQKLGEPADDAALERQNAGLPDGVGVCVLYDRRSEFARGAFAALREVTAEAGWSVRDCGSDDYAKAVQGGGWDAVIARTPIPETPSQIAEQWGSSGSASVVPAPNGDRDALIEKLAQTTDVYEAREVLAQIEATIVQSAVALPIAINPRITIIDPRVDGVSTRSGGVASLTSGVTQWTVKKR